MEAHNICRKIYSNWLILNSSLFMLLHPAPTHTHQKYTDPSCCGCLPSETVFPQENWMLHRFKKACMQSTVPHFPKAFTNKSSQLVLTLGLFWVNFLLKALWNILVAQQMSMGSEVPSFGPRTKTGSGIEPEKRCQKQSSSYVPYFSYPLFVTFLLVVSILRKSTV